MRTVYPYKYNVCIYYSTIKSYIYYSNTHSNLIFDFNFFLLSIIWCIPNSKLSQPHSHLSFVICFTEKKGNNALPIKINNILYFYLRTEPMTFQGKYISRCCYSTWRRNKGINYIKNYEIKAIFRIFFLSFHLKNTSALRYWIYHK